MQCIYTASLPFRRRLLDHAVDQFEHLRQKIGVSVLLCVILIVVCEDVEDLCGVLGVGDVCTGLFIDSGLACILFLDSFIESGVSLLPLAEECILVLLGQTCEDVVIDDDADGGEHVV